MKTLILGKMRNTSLHTGLGSDISEAMIRVHPFKLDLKKWDAWPEGVNHLVREPIHFGRTKGKACIYQDKGGILHLLGGCQYNLEKPHCVTFKTSQSVGLGQLKKDVVEIIESSAKDPGPLAPIQEASPLTPGDRVYLKNFPASQHMTVNGVEGDKVECVWDKSDAGKQDIGKETFHKDTIHRGDGGTE